MKNKAIKIVGILVLIFMILTSYSIISIGGFKYKGTSYETIKSLSDLAKNNNDLFREIPASLILSAWLDYGDLDPYSSNVVCMEHYNKNDSGKFGYVWRVIDINPDGVNTLRVNGKSWAVNDTYTKRYLNAVAEAAANSEKGGWDRWGLSDTKAAYVSLANSKTLSEIFKLNGDYGEYDYVYDSDVEWYINKYWEDAKEPANASDTDVVALNPENAEAITTSNGTIIGPFKYKSANGTNIPFSNIKITGKDNNNRVIFEKNITNPSDENLYTDSLGTKKIANGSIKSEQDFYIKTDNEVANSAKINVEINTKGVGYYQTRILLYRHDDQQTFSSYSVGNGKTNESGKPLEYEFDNNRGNIEIHKSGRYNGQLVKKVENMGYKVFYRENNKNKYLIIENEKAIGTTENVNEASIVYTDKNGDAYVKRVDSRYQYYLEEITDKTDYSSEILKATQKLDKKGAKEIDVPIVAKGTVGPIPVEKEQDSKRTTVKLENTRKTGTLKIIKEDYDKDKMRIFGAKFKVQNVVTEKWVKATGTDGKYKLKTYDESYKNDNDYYNENYTPNENEATEFETNKNGEILIEGIDIGKYVLKEVYIYNDEGKINYGYTEIDKPSNINKEYVYWSTDNEKTKNNLAEKEMVIEVKEYNKQQENILYVYNKKQFLKIRGYVWEDIRGGKANEYTYRDEKDNILNEGDKYYKDRDALVEGISVRLKDRNGNTINSTKTDSNGKYEFTEVSRKAIENNEYYIEFEYNGLTYTSVTTLVGNDSSINSKAGEAAEQRKSLNAAFAEITNKDGNINDRKHGYSRNSSGGTTGELTYENHQSEWYSKFISTTYDNKTYENVNLTANTDINTNPEVKKSYNLKDEFTAGRYTIGEDGAMIIENVNLGLRKREMPSTSIKNDLTSVKVQVNGYGATYENDTVGNKYGTRKDYIEKDEETNEYKTNLSAKFGDGIGSYTREIYPSDIQASSTQTDETKKLKVYATYTITIKNNSNTIGVSVPEIVNYYDSKFSIIENGTDFATGKLNGVEMVFLNGNKESRLLNHRNLSDVNGYKTEYITVGNITDAPIIEAGKTLQINVTYQVNDDTVLKILSEGDQNLSTVAEINGYSVHYSQDAEGCKKGDFYAAIDRVSAPGNATPGVIETYENDTDLAPSFILTAKGIRQLEGTVFEDKDDNQNDNERKGNGKYDSEEKTIKGVTVTLLNKEDGSKATYYPDAVSVDGQNPARDKINVPGTQAEIVTGEDGYYVFRGVEPGEYLIKYTYANGTTEIYDTEGNKVEDVVQRYKSTIINSPIKEAFNENDKHDTWYKESAEIRNSDARDDYDQRIAIDAEIMTIQATTEITHNSLDAETPYFVIPMEVEPVIARADDQNAFVHRIENIDFGIIERPRQQVTLEKTVDNIKVTLPSIEGEGSVLFNGAPEDLKENVLVTENQIHVIMDNELIYGSHLELKYGLKLTNTSELDYTSKEYYYYGTVNEELQPVKITGATVVDYLDKNLVLGNVQNEWEVLDMSNKGFSWNLNSEEEQTLLNKFSTIVKTEALNSGETLAPTESKTMNITAEKLLSDNDNNLVFENKSEVAKVVKTGGSYLYNETPGNYAPRLVAPNVPEGDPSYVVPQEPDEDDAPTTGIVPPTGLTNHNVLYAIIGITSLIALGAGTYGIRRFLKK